MLSSSVPAFAPGVAAFAPSAPHLAPQRALLATPSVRPVPRLRPRARAVSTMSMAWTGGYAAAELLLAGVDKTGMQIPDLDGFYFAGVLVCVVCAGLLQYQSYGGKVGLGKYLSTGPEDKNWEQRQAREAMEKDLKMNKENQGSWLANVLPKLDFVEVYGQDKPAKSSRAGGVGGAGPEAKDAGIKSVAEAMVDLNGSGSTTAADRDISEVEQLSRDMAAAVERQDYGRAAELKAKLKAVLEDE